MTTPSSAQPTGQQQQQATLAAAEVLATASTVAGAAAVLAPVFAAFKIKSAALHAALSVVMGHPPDAEGFYGPATAQTARLNLIRRAQFLVNSSRRFNEVLARVAGGADPREILDLMAAERRYYGQHMEANWNRMQAAARVDTSAMFHGLLLGWYAYRDKHTSPECLAAHRHNFRADQMPAIGFPGAVHLHCRCWPGPPFPAAPMVGQPGRPPPARVPVPA